MNVPALPLSLFLAGLAAIAYARQQGPNACLRYNNQVVCGPVVARPASTPRQSQRVREYGKIACGWSCLAQMGDIVCASSP